MTTTELGARPTTTPRPLLHDPGYRLLVTATVVSKLGSSVSYLAIPLVAVVALRSTVGQVGLLATLGTLAVLLIGLPSGAWVDRMRRRPVMIAADLTRAALLLSVPAAWALGALTIGQLYAVVLLAGAATVFHDVAAQSHLPQLVGRDRIAQANSLLVTVDAAALIGGRSAGGFLIALVSAPAAIVIDAASYLWSALCLARIRRPEPAPEATGRGHLLADIREGVRFVFGHPSLRAVAVAGACTNLSIQLCQTVLPLLLARELALPGFVIGLFFATGGVGVLCGSLSARVLARRLGAGRVLWLLGLVVTPFGMALAVIDRGPALWLAAGGWLVTTFKVGVDNVLAVSFRQSVTPDRLLGRVNATMRLVLTGSLAAGAALAGLLGELLSVRAALWAGALSLALTWVPIACSPLRRLREIPGL
ncbi:MFS transporter [Streptomyces cinnamoneus]|uniref:MFS transporter n=1 Tax=Streptomyces cinnamoneus TaxID=53446 RepID=A0A2G1XKJ5_STRCJ|nr:MFS transporter [Streptomyces cinnamoneus]PHQ51755.1 MFS transporter [Streptomyces cinnamoneus]PPT12003.1 MFS transporter [Streptomyces cinnamoneus]